MDTGYIWDEQKYLRVQEKHGVTFAEVVDVLESEVSMYFDDPQRNSGRDMCVGPTQQGRMLQVIISDEDLPLYRIITPFPASKEWQDEFKQ